MLSKTQEKYIVHLHNKKFRDKEGVFIAEGKKIISEILNSSINIKYLYASENFIIHHKEIIRQKKINHLPVSKEELKKISCLQEPDDALVVCNSLKETKISFDILDENLIVYLDEIRDPGNLGTIIRNCDWFDIPLIVCSPGTADLYNPKTIQSSMGSFIRVPIIYKELSEIIEQLQLENKKKITVYGAFSDGINLYKKTDFEPGILVIGNEANGISEKNKLLIHQKIAIPKIKANGPESLNAAVAASLIISDFVRRK